MKELLACVEVGGSGIETIVFGGETVVVMEGAHQPPGARLAVAVPGVLDGHRVVAASNLGWLDVDPVVTLGLQGPADVVCNDAEAAAIGEAALRNLLPADILVFVGMGTGIGGAVVTDDTVIASNLFGHARVADSGQCRCGQVGCLETIAAGWALPEELDADDVRRVGDAVARAIAEEPTGREATVVVVGGGLAARFPAIVEHIAAALPGQRVEASAAPASAKSASAWGLQRLVARKADAMSDGGGQ